ncbi:hypothetical protein F3Y22_tig00112507pilonHSYRG00036 [Hibiscus syriacus]|uniref:RNase H type-1 domain-containing protein n=1 Tax=Hibiscus syriacus TaxID=106335 RepID=A0A6A2WWH3_HIBSY|nr:hypothetical protein F3Y22_tig00112507pilonHSYRG00036 [Hibiscus syriacus]
MSPLDLESCLFPHMAWSLQCLEFSLSVLFRSLRNGSTVRFWDDVWFPAIGALRPHAITQNLVDDSLSVSAFARPNGAPSANDIDDGIAWRWSYDHAFNLKTAYATLCYRNWAATNADWKFIWSLSIPKQLCYSLAPPDFLRCAHHWAKLYGIGNVSVHPSKDISAAAGVIRNEEGAWIHGFSKNVVHSSILRAELWGIYEGHLLAGREDMERLDIQTDCKQAWSTRLIWIPRGANTVGDSLAKMAPSSVAHMVLYETPPQAVESILSIDREGIYSLPVT